MAKLNILSERAKNTRENMQSLIAPILIIFIGCLCWPTQCIAQNVEPNSTADANFEGVVHAFPALRDLHGKKLADGEFIQTLEGEHLHVRIRYQFSPDHFIEEQAVFLQMPTLIQEHWSWSEVKGSNVLRRFEVDFKTGNATAEKWQDKESKRWTEDIKVEPGRTFAGFGFVLSIKNARASLIKGEKLELKAIGFTPKPHEIGVEITYDGLDQMPMSGRSLRGDQFTIHPKIPLIARPFIQAPDTHIWLVNPTPPGFLRWEGPLVESDDPITRVDLLPGDPSGTAERVRRIDEKR